MSKKLDPLKPGDTVYLVTPMRGRTLEEVRSTSRPVEADLRKRGLKVFSPSQYAEETNQVWGNPADDAEGFAWDVQKILESDALVMQDGWQHSSGGTSTTRSGQAGRWPWG